MNRCLADIEHTFEIAKAQQRYNDACSGSSHYYDDDYDDEDEKCGALRERFSDYVRNQRYIREAEAKERRELERQIERQKAEKKALKKLIDDLDKRLYNIEHKEEIDRENYIKTYKNAYQTWVELPGNTDKTEEEFVKQLDKGFMKNGIKGPLTFEKQIKYKVHNYFNTKYHRNFFKGENEKKYVLYRMIYIKTKFDYSVKVYNKNPIFDYWYNEQKYFICTDYGFKNLYILDEDGDELEKGSYDYEIGRKAFRNSIKKVKTNEDYWCDVML